MSKDDTTRDRRFLVVTADVAAIEARLVDETEHPRQDFRELANALNARILSFSDVADGAGWVPRLLQRLCGRGTALAWHAFRRRGSFYFTTAENAGYPLAFLLKFRRRTPHVMIAHRISASKKRLVARLFGLFRRIDHMICYSQTQVSFARDYLGVPQNRLHCIDFQVDADFYTPAEDAKRGEGILSVGRELRDYPTLFEAVRGTDIPVTVVASSPWSKRADQTSNREIPPNVTLKKGLSFCELRNLYRNCRAVAVPLQNVDSPAGITSILEAQAVGKPVIVTQTPGIEDSVRDGETALTVPPEDPDALRNAIRRLIENPEEADAIAQAGRQRAIEGKTIDHFIQRIQAVCTST